MNTILFLHGAIASKNQFENLIGKIGDRAGCHAINFSGHGGSAMPGEGLSFEVFQRDMLDYLDAHKIDRADLFGYSLGGYAALLFAARHPDRVDKLFTLNVKFRWDAESTAREIALLDPNKIQQKVPHFAEKLRQEHGIMEWENLLEETANVMKALSDDPVLTEEILQDIHQPVRLAIGDRDRTSSMEETKAIFEKLSQASMLVLPDSPHPFDKIDRNRLIGEMEAFAMLD